MKILSEPLVNYFTLWEDRDLQFKKKLWFSIHTESCSSSLHVVITAYNKKIGLIS